MCFNCPDFIEYCAQGDCLNPNGGPYARYAKFYLGEEYCEHLKEKHGHSNAEWSDRYVDVEEE